VIEHDAPGAAPSTTTVAVDPGLVAIVTDETFNTFGGIGEGTELGIAAGAVATRVDVGEPEAAVVDTAVRSAAVACATTVRAAGVATGLGLPDELPPHAAATTTDEVKNIINAFRTATSRTFGTNALY
jgi:hypothetical protein